MAAVAAFRSLPNIRDVAAQAGVSISTVSRVLNDSGPASAKAREAVARAVDETGFRPNSIGRTLKTAKSRTIGILVPSLKNPIFADAVEGIERTAEEAGYSILLASSRYDPDKELQAIELFLANRVEGLIVTVTDERSSAALDLLRREGVPFVLVFNPVLRPGPSAITIDNRAAARCLVERLIELGHRRVAMIVGRLHASDRSGLRRAGYEDALSDRGIAPGPIVEVSFDASDLSEHCARLCAEKQPPTALFCSTDMLAIAAIRSLNAMGLRVPADMSVAGFDGIAVGERLAPSLATIVQPAEEMGAQALRHLLDRVGNDTPALQLALPYRLRDGESISVPRRGALKLNDPPRAGGRKPT